jgi:hypothetical protein
METEAVKRPQGSYKAVVSNLAEDPNTEPLKSHLERSGK